MSPIEILKKEILKKQLTENILFAAPSVEHLELVGGQTGDFDLNKNAPKALPKKALKLAAVLVPIIPYEDGARVLFIRRAEHLSRHSGQIAFPGGRVDPIDKMDDKMNDRTIANAALRETEEEIGITAKSIEVLGYSDAYETFTGYCVVPVIGFVQPGYQLTLNPSEVAHAFEVPLAYLMDRANHLIESRVFFGQERFFYSMSYQAYYIWGATAGMIQKLSERIYK